MNNPYPHSDPDDDDAATEAMSVIEMIYPILAGRHPAVQGAVIADLAATWLAGHHPPEAREALLELHIKTVRAMKQTKERYQ